MSLLNLRSEADGLFSNGGLMLEIITVLLMGFVATLVLVRLTAALGVAPTTDLDFLAIAYS